MFLSTNFIFENSPGGPYPVDPVQTLGSFLFVFYLGRPGPLNEGGGEPYSQHFLGQHVAGRVPAPVGGRFGWVYNFVFPPSIPSSSTRVGLLSASAAGEATTQVAAGGWCTFPQLSGLAWGEEKINL